ncbi:MAG: hypothetical protein A3D96_00110 [Chlamydiae bacterium RIFCSPHIGHO2_12_FULL_44_59]|nr:MAG: hypothetical protein A2796_04115 [Chlamydiae bacterium RIFCSPHIGHO2_01_FULL_44_39]OGN60925.1 MAG: hypothetical protein A3D96_00110 [Chlamydiae bacterium RIFCSPHIGHO2_12_FULL_44_59]OGN66525.1 MAG: hypothetical protein A2978_05585 [Chlamydiae bacterium RIFCSPLOWO2_01_FULL_44_52]OGN69568.1 MAG: hypothetical protein A3I67_01005 [Chlamydiae bacterium RIFCSPLOWO2_02_FULL_45_22]OGN70843.1 MAG: hypothetical protein A3F79_05910 [Chlamydiae bacterium RIFCSPLOWO2_12_FULL_45_20]
MASPAPSAATLRPREWITPQEQLERLLNYAAKPIARSVSEASTCPISIAGIAKIISQYAVEALSPELTDWYTSLELRGSLPDKVPALPWNMPDILDHKCPIWGDETKPDGTHYKYRDTWSLSLKTPETVNELIASVRVYGEQTLKDQGTPHAPNPLKVQSFWNSARLEHADVRSNHESYWILHTNTVVPGSRNNSYQEQDRMLADISAKFFVNCEVPSLSEVLTTYCNRQIARRERLYQCAYKGNGCITTYTRVKETTQNDHLAVGGSIPSGVSINPVNHVRLVYGVQFIGVAAVRKF